VTMSTTARIIVCETTSRKQGFHSVITSRSHKKLNAHIANFIKNVWTSGTEDAKEMSKEKDLLDINDLVDFFLILLYKQKFFTKFLTTK
jgi:hypothetical protein